MLRPYHRAQGRRKVGPYEVHLAAGRGGIRAEPILFNAIRLGSGVNLEAQNPPTMNQLRAKAGDSRTRCIIATAGGRGLTSAFPPLQVAASLSGQSKV